MTKADNFKTFVCISVYPDSTVDLKIPSSFSFLNDSISKTALSGEKWLVLPKVLSGGLRCGQTKFLNYKTFL